MAERAVQTAKSLLKKATDPHLALLSYRSTPLDNGYSPAQIFIGRQIRSTIPVTKASLQPQIPDAYKLQQLDHNYKGFIFQQTPSLSRKRKMAYQ